MYPATKAEVPLSKRLAYLLQPPTDLLLSRSGPIEWPAALFEYQLDGIKALLSRNALLLADDMGLGKTIQAIGALRVLILQHRVEAALLIVPAGLVTQWQKELRHWAPELRISTVRGLTDERAWQWTTPAHVYLTGYETLRSDFTDNPQSPPRRRLWDVVIIDEAQKIKNRGAEVSRKCKQLLRRRAWALTGTPLENSVDDLASILEFVSPLTDGGAPLRLTPGPELRERHQNLQLRRKKTDVLAQLPPKIVSQIALPLEGAQRDTYERAEREGVIQLREKGETVRAENVLELIMRLKQICNFCPATGQSAKLADIRDRINTLESEGYRALIFSQFTDERHGARAIASRLESLQPLLYTGDLSYSQREATIKQFKENPARKVLVLSLRAGGQGLNLQEASYVFHFDRWWNPAVEHQAEDRSHRLGQRFPVNVYKYTCEGTIEERIDKILQEKQLLFDELVDDVSIDLKAKLTSEELFGLFGLTPPEHARSSQRAAESATNYAEMSGVEFEEHVKRLLERRGWRVETTPLTRDGGIDLIARRDDDVGVEVTLYVQCKNHSSPVGVDVARELNGALPRQQRGAYSLAPVALQPTPCPLPRIAGSLSGIGIISLS
jgi:SNF2 family DNA or RNA helicase